MSEHNPLYPQPQRELSEYRRSLAPRPAEAFKAFTQAVFAEGALDAKTKQLIAVAVAHVTQCPYCIRAHTDAALAQGASPQELMESIWIASEMRAGGAYAHALIALDTIHQHQSRNPSPPTV